MNQILRSEVVGTAGLAIAALAALVLTLVRVPVATSAGELRRTTTLFVVGVMFQALHFAEEYRTGFYERFPEILGLSAWSPSFFSIFNLCWLAIWIGAAIGFRASYRPAFFPVWFFALAATANGIVHPLLSLRVGGYFPGLVTSPFLGIIGIWLWLRLAAMTVSRFRTMAEGA